MKIEKEEIIKRVEKEYGTRKILLYAITDPMFLDRKQAFKLALKLIKFSFFKKIY